MSFGAKIKKLRMKKGLSLQQLADKVEVSKAHIYELEMGKVRNPSVEVLKKLAQIFDVPINFFLQDDGQVEFQVMFRDLQKDFAALDERDREYIELTIQALKNKKLSENKNDT